MPRAVFTMLDVASHETSPHAPSRSQNAASTGESRRVAPCRARDELFSLVATQVDVLTFFVGNAPCSAARVDQAFPRCPRRGRRRPRRDPADRLSGGSGSRAPRSPPPEGRRGNRAARRIRRAGRRRLRSRSHRGRGRAGTPPRARRARRAHNREAPVLSPCAAWHARRARRATYRGEGQGSSDERARARNGVAEKIRARRRAREARVRSSGRVGRVYLRQFQRGAHSDQARVPRAPSTCKKLFLTGAHPHWAQPRSRARFPTSKDPPRAARRTIPPSARWLIATALARRLPSALHSGDRRAHERLVSRHVHRRASPRGERSAPNERASARARPAPPARSTLSGAAIRKNCCGLASRSNERRALVPRRGRGGRARVSGGRIPRSGSADPESEKIAAATAEIKAYLKLAVREARDELQRGAPHPRHRGPAPGHRRRERYGIEDESGVSADEKVAQLEMIDAGGRPPRPARALDRVLEALASGPTGKCTGPKARGEPLRRRYAEIANRRRASVGAVPGQRPGGADAFEEDESRRWTGTRLGSWCSTASPRCPSSSPSPAPSCSPKAACGDEKGV